MTRHEKESRVSPGGAATVCETRFAAVSRAGGGGEGEALWGAYVDLEKLARQLASGFSCWGRKSQLTAARRTPGTQQTQPPHRELAGSGRKC